MEYQALYRKYRPDTFSRVIGQEHITEILKNQVETGHTSHAYLFSGTRGTGKTSTAKILAKAVNCLNPQNGEPCCKCEACKTAAEGNVDIIELDAASNNGVDDMRALIEKAVFAPVRMKKKVYIIDEAHMLSGAAFNALLKTLEEPPSHVMFILATTEPHKIIPTITSRCQRFDFRRLKTSDIIKNLKLVLSQAGADVDDEGLLTIARKANGGMRDALSLADQCVSFCGTHVSAEDVYHILGSADFDRISSLANVLIDSDAKAAVQLLDEILSGSDMSVLVQDLTSHFRSLLLTKLCGICSDILDCTEEDMRKLKEQADTVSQERLLRAIDVLTKVQTDLKYYPQPRILIETAFVKICCPENEESVTAALDRINILEKKIKDGIKVTTTVVKTEEKKTEKPKTPRRVVKEDAMKVYVELCDYLKRDDEDAFSSYLLSSLSQARFAEISGNQLKVFFTNDSANCNTVLERKENYDTALADMGYDLVLVPVNETTDDISDVEATLLEQFGGDIRFSD